MMNEAAVGERGEDDETYVLKQCSLFLYHVPITCNKDK